MKERHKAVPASYLILKNDNNILLGHRINTGYYDNYWGVPAGHVEEGELPIDGLVREVREEVGIELNRETIQLAHAMYRTKHDPTGDRVDYFFTASDYTGEITNMEPHKCSELQWFNIDDLPENIMDHVRVGIEYYKEGVVYSELGIDEVVQNPNIR
ncbi:NUDIX domain-containing protein [Patescibacteria group bacterium]|nr:NUDIX domain-containing protein [Patescibacteria group bacterium]